MIGPEGKSLGVAVPCRQSDSRNEKARELGYEVQNPSSFWGVLMDDADGFASTVPVPYRTSPVSYEYRTMEKKLERVPYGTVPSVSLVILARML